MKLIGSLFVVDDSTSSRSLLWGIVGCLSLTFALETFLESDGRSMVLSLDAATTVVRALGGEVERTPLTGEVDVDASLLGLLLAVISFAVFCVGVCALRAKRSQRSVSRSVSRCLNGGGRLGCVAGVTALSALLLMPGVLGAVLIANLYAVLGLTFAGWMTLALLPDTEVPPTDVWCEACDPRPLWRQVPKAIWMMFGLSVICFTTMNWQLGKSLLIPHGDSSMYEEHLWNLLHGKGFRSYLDQGLFLGEHVQVVHLLLLPLYVLWPSQALLEACQSLALSAGAFPVFAMAARASSSRRVGVLAAAAYLLYPPMQFLDIAIDFKTFRPEAFVIPAMLFAFDAGERAHWKRAAVWALIALSAKEDYALIFAPLGLWIAAQPWLRRQTPLEALTPAEQFFRHPRRAMSIGLSLTIASVGYLLFATKVVMHHFRSGEELHYVRYFSKFGNSFGEVIVGMLTQPVLLLTELLQPTSWMYVIATLAPLGFLPLRALSRFAVAAPLLALLCLNEIVQTDPLPRHHFQASVVPVLIWAVIGALKVSSSGDDARRRATWLCCAAFVGCLTNAQCPLSLRFWDPGSVAYWKTNYIPSRRAELFEVVAKEIPLSARVASTDFVHPRFTHHERSYDYSHYVRRVANYEDRVPEDTDYIVIDTRHRYSDITAPQQVRELRDEPLHWELLDLPTEGYFIVLKRRR